MKTKYKLFAISLLGLLVVSAVSAAIRTTGTTGDNTGIPDNLRIVKNLKPVFDENFMFVGWAAADDYTAFENYVPFRDNPEAYPLQYQFASTGQQSRLGMAPAGELPPDVSFRIIAVIIIDDNGNVKVLN